MKRSAPLFAVAAALAVLCSSCSSIHTTGRERLSAIADKVLAFGLRIRPFLFYGHPRANGNRHAFVAANGAVDLRA
jgi:hypothetical protein